MRIRFHSSVLLTLWLVQSVDAFQSALRSSAVVAGHQPFHRDDRRCSPLTICSTQKSPNDSGEDWIENDKAQPRGNRLLGRVAKKIRSKLEKPMLVLTPALLAFSSFTVAPQTANAGAPVMAMPKTKAQDPVQNAFDIHERKMMVEAQEELTAFQAKAREIERTKGPAARDEFEKEYKEAQKKKAEEWEKGLEQLKRDLLDQGIDPFLDIEGRRQVILYEKGVDLGSVGGTAFSVEKTYAMKSPEKSFAFKKKANREMIKCMVQDLKNRDIDPLAYFSKNHDKTQMILDLPAAKAEALVTQYQTNLDKYGQIAVPKEGEISAKEMMAQKGKSKASKDDEKRLKAEAKAKAAAEKAEAKARAKEEKIRATEEKRAAKEAAKKEQEAAKLASAAAVAAAVTTPSYSAEGDVVPPSDDSASATADGLDDGDGSGGDATAVAEAEADAPVETPKLSKSGGIKIIPAAGVIVAAGGGAFVLKTMRERSSAEEAERQRQFKLLMGEVEKDVVATDAAEGKNSGETMSDLMFEYENETEKDEPESSKAADAVPKKKRRGLKSVFGKKKNDRETDIAVLFQETKAPDFAKTLAKILVFGAPGRFPEISALPVEVDMDDFDLEKASAVLVEAQGKAGITKEESAETFANVVNCMLIDIVDLASSSLKEKDDKTTVNALGIVIEFMDLAAQLYSSIADGVTITPVTYGGDIGKGKLEQMYSAYAASAMTDITNIDEKFDDRLSLLQDVFQINPKKAEGLAMKVMQKNMMEMMKSGKMPEGMEEMMQGMGGMMPGMDGDEPDPEQIKVMLRELKNLKDSGSIPDSELEAVKKQFKESFGSSIEDLMKEADQNQGELADADKEMLDLMKSILS
jgi:hypothetical protein